MKIQLLSDLHNEFETFQPPPCEADVTILAGDIDVGIRGVKWARESFPDRPVLYVLGNHEYYKHSYPKLIDQMKEAALGSTVRVLENEAVVLDGIAFHGCTLWTDFELFGNPQVAGYECQQVMNDFKKIRRDPSYSRLRSIDAAAIHAHSIRWLEKSLQESICAKNVIITHHAPSLQSVPFHYQDDIVTAAYASNLEQFIERLAPTLWCHGHCHNQSDYRIGSTHVVCNPRGYPGEWRTRSHFQDALIIEVQG